MILMNASILLVASARDYITLVCACVGAQKFSKRYVLYVSVSGSWYGSSAQIIYSTGNLFSPFACWFQFLILSLPFSAFSVSFRYHYIVLFGNCRYFRWVFAYFSLFVFSARTHAQIKINSLLKCKRILGIFGIVYTIYAIAAVAESFIF